MRSRRYAMLVEDQVVKVRQSTPKNACFVFLLYVAVNCCTS